MKFKTEELKKIEEELAKYLNSDVEFILKIGNYILNSGGKRLRPLLVLIFAKALKGQNNQNDFPLAVSMEYLHSAILILQKKNILKYFEEKRQFFLPVAVL